MARPGHPHQHRDRCARRLAVALACLVRPVHRLPGPGEVAALALPAALAGRAHHRPPGASVPRPGAGPGARQGPLDPVHRPGAGPAGLRPGRRRLRRQGRESGPRVRRPPLPGPLSPARLPDPGVRPPRRARRDHPGPGHPRARRPEGARHRTTGGRLAVAGPAARHPPAGRRGHRLRERLHPVVARPRPARPAPGRAGEDTGPIRR